MSGDYRDILAEAAADAAHFRGLTFSGGKDGAKVTARPVIVRGEQAVAIIENRDKREAARTAAWADWPEQVRDLLARDFAFLHVRRDDGDRHVKITRKGHALMSRGRPAATPPPAPAAHDREKAYALTPANAGEFLRSLEVLDDQGRIRPSMQAKYRQVNGFLNLLEPALPERPEDPFAIVDCGCGSAHLSFAVFHYLAHVKGWPVRLTGVDRNADLVARNRAWQERLGWSGLSFAAADLADYRPEGRADLVLSLHACDTATDLALARGAAWGARAIVSAPCCQHELHRQLQAEPFRAVLRHGILRERMADLVTDALRAAAMRLCGYTVSVMEFAAPSDTGKNLLIRAVRSDTPAGPEARAEYRDLKAFWNVEPEIERLLKSGFEDRFA